jgi:multicomponent Na+:H+ antiporter subunit E
VRHDPKELTMCRLKFKRFVRRLLLLAGLWWLLAGRDALSWLLGGPVVLTLAAWQLNDAGDDQTRFRLWRLVPFVPFFLWRSLAGSCDVAWRALHWRLPIAPAVQTYRFHLPPGSMARVLFANCINLLPGTLAATWKEDELQVHLLAESPGSAAALRQLEEHVALLLGHDAPPPIEETCG